MFDHVIAEKKVGVFCPRDIVDDSAWEFYKLAPPGIMICCVPMGVERFTREDVERVYAGAPEQIRKLKERKVDLIWQTGVPLQCLIGLEAHDKRLAYLHELSGLPVTSGILAIIAACKRLGIRNLAIGDKFTDSINDTLVAFLKRGGVGVAGYYTWENDLDIADASTMKKMSQQQLIDIGYEVGRKTFERFPDCDAIYMPGGSWSLDKVVVDLEREFGRPVFAHHFVEIWNIATLLGMWKPQQGRGMLFASE